MLTRGSHRSGRAGLPHPVPQMTTSLRTQSLTANSDCYPLALRLRGVGVRSLRHVSCRRACHLTRRFPPPGPLGSSSPNSTVLSTRYDFLPPIPPHFVAFAWRYQGNTRGFAPAAAECCDVGPGVGHPVSPAGNSSMETTGSPTFLGNLCAYALLFDPGGTDVSGRYDTPTRPPL